MARAGSGARARAGFGACAPAGPGYPRAGMASDRDMGLGGDERLWLRRLRWRLRGALQGPAFVLATLVEAVLLNRLPVAGDEGLDPFGGLLAAAFLNLAIVAVAAPLLTRLGRLRRRRSAGRTPIAIATDRTATLLMGAVAAGVLLVGLVHRGEVQESRAEYRAQLNAVRAYLAHQAPSEYRASIGLENVWKQGDDFYRTCVPGRDARRSLCLFVDTSGPAVSITRDPDQQSNAKIAGPENPGRLGG